MAHDDKSLRGERRRLIQAIRRRRGTDKEIAGELRARYGVGPMTAFRWVNDLSLADAAKRYNQARDDPEQRMTGARIWEWERWPGPRGRRPPVDGLVTLSEVYRCHVGDLIDAPDHGRLDQPNGAGESTEPEVRDGVVDAGLAAARGGQAESGVARGRDDAEEPAVGIVREAEDRLVLYQTLIVAFDALGVDPGRRRFLHRIGASAADAAALGGRSGDGPAIERGPVVAGSAGEVDPGAVEDLAVVVGAHRRLYRRFSAEQLLPATLGHVQMASRLVRRAPSQARDRLVASIGQASMLAGTLLFHDLGDPATASAYYKLTEIAARRLEDQEMLAYLLGCMSFLACYAGRSREAVTLVERAVQTAARFASPETRAWLHAVAGEVHATAGEASAAMRSLDAARGVLGVASQDDPSWLGIGVFDLAKLDAYYGTCYLRLRDFRAAVSSLSEALGGLHPSWLKHRCTALSDLALAHAGLGQVDAACERGVEAIEIILTLQHAVNIDRLKQLRRLLQPHASSRAVQEFDACLATVA